MKHTQAPRDGWRSARRGMRLRCPNCGKGGLFARYLKPVDTCGACGETLGHIRADDGPAWATILLVGHLISPIFFVFAMESEVPDWVAPTAICSFALLLCLLLLPRMKGLFIGFIWASGADGVDTSTDQPGGVDLR